MKLLLNLSILALSLQLAYSEDEIILTEGVLKQMINDNPPTVKQIEASFLGTKASLAALDDALGFRLEGEGQTYRSKERLLGNLDGGVTERSTSFSLGLVKPTRYGLDVGLSAFGGKISNAFIKDAASTGMTVSLSLDLLKDFLGRTTDNNLKKSEYAVRRAELEKQASLKSFESNIRKLYWALVANNEQRLLLEGLVKLSYQQFQEAVQRKKSSVADAGEVARYRSQWTTRKASLLSLQYQKGEIMRSLKELLPDLNGKKIELGKYSVPTIINSVLTCSAKIGSHQNAPINFTPFDEIVNYLKKEEVHAQAANDAYDDASIKLIGEYSSVGRDFGIGAARDNFSDDPRGRTSIGLALTIPIGGRKQATQEIQEKLYKNKYLSQAEGNLSKIKAFHSETAEIIKILRDVVKNQKETNKYLAESLKVSRRKFKQARIGVQELISEQDTLLDSKVGEIQTNLTIINTLMDYFSIYNDFPCELNRI